MGDISQLPPLSNLSAQLDAELAPPKNLIWLGKEPNKYLATSLDQISPPSFDFGDEPVGYAVRSVYWNDKYGCYAWSVYGIRASGGCIFPDRLFKTEDDARAYLEVKKAAVARDNALKAARLAREAAAKGETPRPIMPCAYFVVPYRISEAHKNERLANRAKLTSLWESVSGRVVAAMVSGRDHSISPLTVRIDGRTWSHVENSGVEFLVTGDNRPEVSWKIGEAFRPHARRVGNTGWTPFVGIEPVGNGFVDPRDAIEAAIAAYDAQNATWRN